MQHSPMLKQKAVFLLVPAYPGCPGTKAVKRLLLLLVAVIVLLCSKSDLVDVVITFGRCFNSAAAVGIAIDQSFQLAGVDYALRVSVRFVSSDHKWHILMSCPSSGRRLTSLRQVHLFLQATSLVEALPTVDAENDEEKVACNIDIVSQLVISLRLLFLAKCEF